MTDIDFPQGSWVTRPAQDEDGDDFLWLFPPGLKATASIETFDCGDCEFSPGNSWPDTLEMKEFIEQELARGHPITFQFKNPYDAAACYARLLQTGVASR